MEEEKCFLITDMAGKFTSFVITENALPLNGERLTKQQETIAQQLKKTIAEIISA